VLGATTAKRSPALPDVPAIAEVVPGYDSAVWYGVLAPAGTPADIIVRLNREVLHSLKQPEMSQRLRAEALETIGSTPEALRDYMKNEMTKWAHIVKEAHVRAD
jgi:tripartite-type tricarboxylate transporter receptor subunit TctC